MVEETNKTLFLKRQNDLKGKQLDVLEHLGQLRRSANICQDLAHLGSKGFFQGLGLMESFCPFGKTSPNSSHARTVGTFLLSSC